MKFSNQADLYLMKISIFYYHKQKHQEFLLFKKLIIFNLILKFLYIIFFNLDLSTL